MVYFYVDNIFNFNDLTKYSIGKNANKHKHISNSPPMAKPFTANE